MGYEIPRNWEGLKLGAFSEIQKLKPSEFDSSFEYKLERLALILDEDPDELEEKLTIEQLTDLTIKTNWINGKPKGEFVEQIEGFTFKGFKRLTLGEFIDLQNLCSKGYYINAGKILAILYRRTKLGEWGELIIEPRTAFNSEQRAEEFDEIPVTLAAGAIHEYLTFQENFINRRAAIFGIEQKEKDEPEVDEDEEELEDEADEPETKDEIEDRKREEKLKKWSWEYFIYKGCKGDLTKFDEFTELPLTLVFNIEAMKMELNIQE